MSIDVELGADRLGGMWAADAMGLESADEQRRVTSRLATTFAVGDRTEHRRGFDAASARRSPVERASAFFLGVTEASRERCLSL